VTTGPNPEDAPKSGFFRSAKKKAQDILKNGDKLNALLSGVAKKLSGPEKAKFSEIAKDLKALVRLVTAYAKGTYRDIAPETLVLIIAALVYFLNPLDLIPDPLPGGFIDDGAVTLFVIQLVRDELDSFIRWEGGSSDDS
jgi:uncharacterized membrane protein YkvA (DUF1232 family)